MCFQRLDYFLASPSVAVRADSCDILGHGSTRVGFVGSDHSPVILILTGASGAKGASGGAHSNEEKEGEGNTEGKTEGKAG